MTKEEKVARFQKMNQDIRKGQILCAGSSQMEMFPVEKFVKEEYPGTIIYNRGIGGYITNELLEHLDVCVLDLQPSRLFINIGTNDLSNPDVTIDGLMKKYDEILCRIEEAIPNIEIYLMAYFPINYEAATEEMKPCLLIRTNKRINEANKAVAELARKHQARYIDINDPLKDADGNLRADYTIEGMHIKEEGYRSIFPMFMKYALEPKWK